MPPLNTVYHDKSFYTLILSLQSCSLLHCDADIAFVMLYTEHELLSLVHPDGIIQNHGSLFPMGGFTWGVQPDLIIKAQMKPKWDSSYSSRSTNADLKKLNFEHFIKASKSSFSF